MNCSCGSKDFHTFYDYKALGIKRVRCKECNKTYEIKDKKMVEIDLKKMWLDMKDRHTKP